MNSWPTTLPEKFSRNFETTDVDTLLRSEMEYGPQKVRRRFTGNIEQIQTSINLTEEQVGILRNFYRNTLGGGTLPFTHKYPTNNTVVEYRFLAPPAISHLGGKAWMASLQLEVIV